MKHALVMVLCCSCLATRPYRPDELPGREAQLQAAAVTVVDTRGFERTWQGPSQVWAEGGVVHIDDFTLPQGRLSQVDVRAVSGQRTAELVTGIVALVAAQVVVGVMLGGALTRPAGGGGGLLEAFGHSGL